MSTWMVMMAIGPLDPTVMSILLAMSRGCQVYFGFGMELATGQGWPD